MEGPAAAQRRRGMRRIQPAPAIATWFLKLFCSSGEDESLIGDLLENYQQGRGRFWYWRQVTAIVFLRIGRNVRQLSLSAAATPIRQALTLLLAIAAISAVLLSDIWMILLIGILGGVIAGPLIFLLGNRINERRKSAVQITTDHQVSHHPGISIHHIPVEGAVGLLFVFGTVFIFAVGVPAVREIFFLTIPLGALALGILHYWHKHHSVKIEALDLHKH
jgi:hypothetical protein